MSRPMRVHVLVLLILFMIGLSACGGPEPQPLQFGEATWQSGEMSRYGITGPEGDYGGTVQYDLTAVDDDVWRMERTIEAPGGQELLTVDMARRGYRPQSSEWARTDREGQERVKAVYDSGEVSLETTSKQDVLTIERVNVPSDSRDARSLVMLVRTLPLDSGYSTRVNTFLPLSERMARAEVTVLGKEEIDTPAGTYATWVVELDEGDTRSRVWIGIEPPHPLVQYLDGVTDSLIVLSEFRPGE